MGSFVVLFSGKLNSQETRFRTALTAASAVIPKCLKRSFAGALAPKECMPINSPSWPITASQPQRTAASIATLTGALPMMAARFASGCANKSSSEGSEVEIALGELLLRCDRDLDLGA